MAASPREDPAACFESNLALKLFRYCVGQGKSLDLTQNFENFTADATCYNALLCLLDMLPTMGKHRTSAKNARQNFINEIKIGDSLEAYLESCQQENKKLERFQPYILKMGATE
ncbi:uncharacterized protein LOC124806109 [Hydra vulgaris]|uniref:uncharacterized protein LOC124806109 n=1 Tax=Hydra vulgaris TaxID=6087 RepID=UPI0032E9CB07